jgi:fructose-1,6-bisphosphatase/inositol monophosphatase family enzyme
LRGGEIEEKSPGEVVTIVDREVEAFLSRELTRMAPDSVVIGEEACAADPALMQHVRARRAWLLDPLDGTGNFVAGKSEFAILVALLEDGECVAGWMWRPLDRVLYHAQRGRGAAVNGERLAVRAAAAAPLRGIVKTRFLPDALRGVVIERARVGLEETQAGANCTAFDYPDIVAGTCDFALYWRTLPWDHAAGVLLLEEAGGFVRRLDGSRYEPGDPRDGLLAAADERRWNAARDALFTAPPPRP